MRALLLTSCRAVRFAQLWTPWPRFIKFWIHPQFEEVLQVTPQPLNGVTRPAVLNGLLVCD